jgi:DNA methyltransferase 1-associated protein 1
MADVRDILGVPRSNTSVEKPDAPPKPKEKVQRPAGMSREAFALLGGSHPIVPSALTEELRKKEDLKGFKQKRKASAKGQVGKGLRRAGLSAQLSFSSLCSTLSLPVHVKMQRHMFPSVKLLHAQHLPVLQVTWQWQHFSNPARNDGLMLEHWVKCYKDSAGKIRPADEGEYPFAKYNKKAGSHTSYQMYQCSVVLQKW